MIPPTEQPSAESLLKMLPFELIRLKRHLLHGPPHETINALSVVSDLRLARHVREAIWGCCEHSDPKVRSKAVLMLGDLLVEGKDDEADRLLAEALVDADDRVRANAVEVLERTQNQHLASLLEARSRLGRNRERANAIKAMASMRLCDPEKALFEMLRDRRDPHRLSALWAVEQTGQWKLLEEIARLARHDSNVRVRGSAEATVQRMAKKMSKPARKAA